MDSNAATLWWVVAGVLVAAELATGTFYLLMLALGAAAGALAAHAGAGLPSQILTAAVLGGAATSLWHWRRRQQPGTAPASANRDVNLDIGERVHVAAWNPDGSAHVQYRGARWTVAYGGQDTPQPGDHFIVAMDGNRLVVAPTRPA
ncbi:NfeD family protein [Ideonella sp. BN130291]|uniref:NfeD family protein n=1 Tax=Ideonella sp. BN130291 TaxID=3112940 RepID=UPI002E25AB44|nr:NfeD family protein [Ideonella sp. BN130291]